MDAVPPVVMRYLDAYNAMDVAAMLGCLSDDILFVNKSGGAETNRTKGISEFRGLAEQGVQLFAERRQEVTDCIAIDDRVALRIAYRATIRADLPNGWKAGQVIEMAGTSFITLTDGKISELVDAS